MSASAPYYNRLADEAAYFGTFEDGKRAGYDEAYDEVYPAAYEAGYEAARAVYQNERDARKLKLFDTILAELKTLDGLIDNLYWEIKEYDDPNLALDVHTLEETILSLYERMLDCDENEGAACVEPLQ